MKIALGSDHRGFGVKQRLTAALVKLGHEVRDLGVDTGDGAADYPDFAIPVSEAVAKGDADRGILVCGTGFGMCIAANKVAGIRAALCYNEELAKLAREHNNALVLSIGARMNSAEEAKAMARTFLATEYSADPRHQRRIDMLTAYEQSAALPPLPGSVD